MNQAEHLVQKPCACRIWGVVRPPQESTEKGKGLRWGLCLWEGQAGSSEMTRSESGVVSKLALRVGRVL